MKRVLIFSLAYYPHVGGAEVAIKEITDRIRDIQFDMVTLKMDSKDASEEQVGNVHVHRIGSGSYSKFSKLLFQFRAALRARRLHRTRAYDAIWAVMAHSAGVPAALFKMRFPLVPYILTLQEGDPTDQIERTMLPLWPLFRQAFIRADILQAISTFLESWGRRMGFAGDSVIIPNGVTVTEFIGDSIKHEGTVLITTSRLVRKNGLDAVIAALPQLPDVRFRILGTGSEEKKLRELAKRCGVSDRVEFLGFIDMRDIPAHLRAADIFIRPSRSEGMGNSFIEAMAAGLPVIATQVGGIADFLFDAERNPGTPPTGWAVDPDSPEQVATQVRKILENPEHTQVVLANARALVSQKYDWSTIARAMGEKVFALL